MKKFSKSKLGFWVIFAFFTIMGGVIGFLSAKNDISFPSINIDFIFTVFAVLLPVISTIFTIIVLIFKHKYKKYSVNLDDDENYYNANKANDVIALLSTIIIYLVMASCVMSMKANIGSNLFQFVLSIYLILLLIISIISGHFSTKNMVEFINQDNINPYDKIDINNAIDNFDEGAKAILHKSGYKAYKIINAFVGSIFIIAVLLNIFLEVNLSGYVLLLLVIQLVIILSFSYFSWIEEHK